MSLGSFLLRKTAVAILTMLTVSFLIFLAFEVNVADVAVKVLGQYSTPPSARPGWPKTATTIRS